MYVIEVEKPELGKPGKYFAGNKVRGQIFESPEECFEALHMSLPDVSHENILVPDEVASVVELALSDAEAAFSGDIPMDHQHVHIGEIHHERHKVWPLLVGRAREVLGLNRKRKPHDKHLDENTSSIEEIYDQYL
jgi:hypothetical protein